MKKLEALMKERGLGPLGLSEAMKDKGYSLSRVSIMNILNEKNSPKLSTLQEIADTLGVHVCDFIDEREHTTKPIFERNEDGTYKEIGRLNSKNGYN